MKSNEQIFNGLALVRMYELLADAVLERMLLDDDSEGLDEGSHEIWCIVKDIDPDLFRDNFQELRDQTQKKHGLYEKGIAKSKRDEKSTKDKICEFLKTKGQATTLEIQQGIGWTGKTIYNKLEKMRLVKEIDGHKGTWCSCGYHLEKLPRPQDRIMDFIKENGIVRLSDMEKMNMGYHAFTSHINRMLQRGKIKRVSRGVYCAK